MAVKLWTVHFMRICVANLLLFISLYILFPVLSVEMADRLGVPVAQTGVIFLFFTLGMFLIGPFHAYLVDAYKRKYVCMFSFATMVAATAGYAFVTNITELILLSTVQGLAFGIATTAGITLAIDITNATLRSAGNVSFSWMARLGMIIGIVLGVWLYQSYSFKNLLSVSVITGAAGVLMVSGVYVPFRAPIVTRLYSFDRFLLLRGWVPAINMILITFVPGLLIPLVHRFLNDSVLGSSGIPIPFFVGTGIGYLASLLLARLFILKEKTDAAGARRHHTGDCSHHSAGLRFPGRRTFHTLGFGTGVGDAGISGHVRETVTSLSAGYGKYHSSVGQRSRIRIRNSCCVLLRFGSG